MKITEVADEPHKDNLCAKMSAQVMEAEASRIEKHIRKSSFIIALDVHGKIFSSEELAAFFKTLWFLGIQAFRL